MLRKWIYILLILIMFSALVACNKEEVKDNEQEEDIVEVEPQPEPEQEEQEGSGGFLWKTTHNDITVYMLGSVHVATRDFYPLHADIEEAFEQSDYVAVEADILAIDPLESQALMDEMAMYTDGTTLADHIPAELYAELQTYLEQYGIPMETVDSYEPWFVYMLLDSLRILKFGYNAELGIDQHFLEAAVETEKEIIELESVEFQMSMFDSFPIEVQQYLVESSLDEASNAKDEMDKMLTLWKNGEEEALEEMILATDNQTEEEKIFTTALLDDRNVGMTDKIEGFLNGEGNEQYFVIVGAAHYFGEKGILQLLEDRGYTVEKEL